MTRIKRAALFALAAAAFTLGGATVAGMAGADEPQGPVPQWTECPVIVQGNEVHNPGTMDPGDNEISCMPEPIELPGPPAPPMPPMPR